VSESTTSLTGESGSDATDADASVLANDPTIHELPGLLLTQVTKRPQADACGQPGELE
jgi:hypothetical protein